MHSATSPALEIENCEAAKSLREKGYYIFNNVLTDAEISRLLDAANQYFKTGGRFVEGGAKKQVNAAIEVPSIAWVFHHPALLSSLRQALGSNSIMFTNHAALQRDVLGGWHKDDGTDDLQPDLPGYFSKLPYGRDDCRVFNTGIYLQSHDRDKAGLFVREGSHRSRSYTDGPIRYLGAPTGSLVVFDVRITHSGQFKSEFQQRLYRIANHLPQRRLFDAGFARARRMIRSALGRERTAIFCTYGLANENTVEFARTNMLRQCSFMPGTSPNLPQALRTAFEQAHVQLAEDHLWPNPAGNARSAQPDSDTVVASSRT